MQPEISLLIDGDQVTPADVGKVMQRLEQEWQITSRVCIRNWRSSKDVAQWKDAAREYALQCLQRDPVATGKNASDIELAILAMDQFHGLGYRAFCLISADTDFTPLVDRLRRAACHVDWVRDTQAMGRATATRERAAAREGRGRRRGAKDAEPAPRSPPASRGAKAPATRSSQRPASRRAATPAKPAAKPAAKRGAKPSVDTGAAAKQVRRAIAELRKAGKHDRGAVPVQRIGQWLTDNDIDRGTLGGSKSAPLWKTIDALPGVEVEQREDGRYWVTME